jgi:hypothetical protein
MGVFQAARRAGGWRRRIRRVGTRWGFNAEGAFVVVGGWTDGWDAWVGTLRDGVYDRG